MSDFHHISVLLDELVSGLAPRDGEVFVDCTTGGAGHAAALLEAADIRLVCLDRDPDALAVAGERLARFGDRVSLHHADFASVGRVLDELGLDTVDGLYADLGVSSPQLDRPERGFSFRSSGPLDMRMDPTRGQSAAELIDHLDEGELTRIIREYGEEKQARRVARLLVQGRPWHDTATLAQAIAGIVREKRIHPATRTFQALRIAVNDELGQLDALLPVALERVAVGGRIGIIAFHSLEDRRVKRFFAAESGRGAPTDPYGNPLVTPRLAEVRRVLPAEDDPNPRARSARLRLARRC